MLLIIFILIIFILVKYRFVYNNKKVYKWHCDNIYPFHKKLTKNESISFHNMKTLVNHQNKLIYTYKLTNGISDIYGGINVLIDMDYPSDIIKNAKLCG